MISTTNKLSFQTTCIELSLYLFLVNVIFFLILLTFKQLLSLITIQHTQHSQQKRNNYSKQQYRNCFRN